MKTLKAKKESLTKEELEGIKALNTEFQKMKNRLGELEMEKHYALKKIDAIREEFIEKEQNILKKYGPDTVINMQTGEITKKENG